MKTWHIFGRPWTACLIVWGLFSGLSMAQDSDYDGLDDYDEENYYYTDPWNSDSDGDGYSDGDEVLYDGTDPNDPNSYSGSDGGYDDPYSYDSDGDGLSDGEEYDSYYTDPYLEDTDGDGYWDGDEVLYHGTDPNDGSDYPGSGSSDSDGDGLSDDDESNVYFTDPYMDDTDGDGYYDGEEVNTYGTDPTDSADYPGSSAYGDSDSDGLTDDDETNIYFTDPYMEDTDGDGYWDGDEVNVYGTDPNDSTDYPNSGGYDSDGDGLEDDDEYNFYYTDPYLADSDGDGHDDGEEVAAGTDPNDSGSFPSGGGMVDLDNDGMDDDWETLHGLDPTDASDTAYDPDYDRLTNLQEFQGNTAPTVSWNYQEISGTMDLQTLKSLNELGQIVRVLPNGDIEIWDDGGWLIDGSLGSGPSLLVRHNTSGMTAAVVASAPPGTHELRVWDSTLHVHALPDAIASTADIELRSVTESGFVCGRYKASGGCWKVFIWDGTGLSVVGDPSMDTSLPGANGRGELLLQSASGVKVWASGIESLLSGEGLALNSRGKALLSMDAGSGTLTAHLWDGSQTTNTGLETSGWTDFFLNSEDYWVSSGHASLPARLVASDHVSMDLTEADSQGGDRVSRILGLNDMGEAVGRYTDNENFSDPDGSLTFELGEALAWRDGAAALVGTIHDDSEVVAITNSGILAIHSKEIVSEEIGGTTAYSTESRYGLLVPQNDPDSDGMPDDWEAFHAVSDPLGDPDTDGLSNLGEYLNSGDPNEGDSDGDTLSDGWEFAHGYDLNWALDATHDVDQDGLASAEEAQYGTSPARADTDGDGIPDKYEIDHGLDPLLDDAGLDADTDGRSNEEEFQDGTNPQNSDSDGDGLSDSEEVIHLTDPNIADTDGDGVSDAAEIVAGTSPLVEDTDGDGSSDWFELQMGTDPIDSASTPGGQIGESGTLQFSQSNPNQWFSVSLEGSYFNPVVVLGGVSHFDEEPLTFRTRSVTASSFEFQLDEWNYLDGVHGEEQLSYLVVESGTHKLPDGSRLNAGKAFADYHGSTIALDGPSFSSAPVLVGTLSGEAPNAAASVRFDQVTAGAFVVRAGGEEGDRQPGSTLTPMIGSLNVHWIAWEPGIAAWSVAVIPQVDHQAVSALFGLQFPYLPVLLADLQSFADTDPATLRITSLAEDGFTLYAQEEQSADDETDRTSAEMAGYVAILPGSLAGTLGFNGDQDGDGFSDEWEYLNQLEMADSTVREADPDLDQLTNAEEYAHNTHFDNNDSDGDGLEDGWELDFGFDPLSSTNGGTADFDGDGYTNAEEAQSETSPIDVTDHPGLLSQSVSIPFIEMPQRQADTDGDGYGDQDEIRMSTDPLDILSFPNPPALDADGDRMDDTWELANGLDPQNPDDAGLDLDSDNVSNLYEYALQSNPRDAVDRVYQHAWTIDDAPPYSEIDVYGSASVVEQPVGQNGLIWDGQMHGTGVISEFGVPEPTFIGFPARFELTDTASTGIHVGRETPADGAEEQNVFLAAGEKIQSLPDPSGTAIHSVGPGPLVNNFGQVVTEGTDGKIYFWSDDQWTLIGVGELLQISDRGEVLVLMDPGTAQEGYVVWKDGVSNTITLPQDHDLQPSSLFKARMNRRGDVLLPVTTIDNEGNESGGFLFYSGHRMVGMGYSSEESLEPDIADFSNLGIAVMETNSSYVKWKVIGGNGILSTWSEDDPNYFEPESSDLAGLTDTGWFIESGLYAANPQYSYTGNIARVAAPDRDGDLLPDDWEVRHGLDPDDHSDGRTDLDWDGLDNVREFILNTDPGYGLDGDGDGMPDLWELAHGLDPADPADAQEDPDGDGITNGAEFLNRTDPNDLYNGMIADLSVLSGDGQTAAPEAEVNAPLVILAQDPTDGLPLVSFPILFEIVSSGGQISDMSGGALATQMLVETDANGHAEIWFTQPAALNADSTIRASAGQAVPVEASFQSVAINSGPSEILVTPVSSSYSAQVIPSTSSFTRVMAAVENLMVIGMPLRGEVDIYHRTSGSWQLVQTIGGEPARVNEKFGSSLAIADGRVLVGAPEYDGAAVDSGAVYSFSDASGTWLIERTLNPPSGVEQGRFGASMDASGNLIAIGEPGRGRVHVHETWMGYFSEDHTFSNPAAGDFGALLAISDHRVAIGSSNRDYPVAIHERSAEGAWRRLDVGLDYLVADFAPHALDLDGGNLVLSWQSLQSIASGVVQIYSLDRGYFYLAESLRSEDGTGVDFGRQLSVQGENLAITEGTLGLTHVYQQSGNARWDWQESLPSVVDEVRFAGEELFTSSVSELKIYQTGLSLDEDTPSEEIVAWIQARDPDDDALTVSLADDVSGKFTLSPGENGQMALMLAAGQIIDADDGLTYDPIIRVEDPSGEWLERTALFQVNPATASARNLRGEFTSAGTVYLEWEDIARTETAWTVLRSSNGDPAEELAVLDPDTEWYVDHSVEGEQDQVYTVRVTAPSFSLDESLTVQWDADSDLIADWWERVNGLDPTDGTDALLDIDSDGDDALTEYQAGTDPSYGLPPTVTLAFSPAPVLPAYETDAFSFQVDAASFGVALREVQLYSDTELLHTLPGGNLSSLSELFTLEGLPVGNHVLHAEAVDLNGQSTVSSTLSIDITSLGDFLISMDQPLDGAVVDLHQPLTLSATASRQGIEIVRTTLYRDSIPFAEAEDDSVIGVLTDLPVGTHTFQAAAWDARGNMASTAPITVTVQTSDLIHMEPGAVSETLLPATTEDVSFFLINEADANQSVRLRAVDNVDPALLANPDYSFQVTGGLPDIGTVQSNGTVLLELPDYDMDGNPDQYGEAYDEVLLGFDFKWFGQTFDRIFVKPNGLIHFGTHDGPVQITPAEGQMQRFGEVVDFGMEYGYYDAGTSYQVGENGVRIVSSAFVPSSMDAANNAATNGESPGSYLEWTSFEVRIMSDHSLHVDYSQLDAELHSALLSITDGTDTLGGMLSEYEFGTVEISAPYHWFTVPDELMELPAGEITQTPLTLIASDIPSILQGSVELLTADGLTVLDTLVVNLRIDGANADTDGDGLPDEWEMLHFGDLSTSDGGDLADADGDGVLDRDEFLHGTDPNAADSDGDGIPDVDEIAAGLNPTVADAHLDLDGDGLLNGEEFRLGTRMDLADSDGDGLTDAEELGIGTGPGLTLDNLTNGHGYTGSFSNPNDSDTDGDGIRDSQDVDVNRDDRAEDPDEDGLTNAQEAKLGTDPQNEDSDGDGALDGNDAIPYFKGSSLPKRSIPSYSVIDLGEGAEPLGMNSSVQVIFSRDDDWYFWEKGEEHRIASTHEKYPPYLAENGRVILTPEEDSDEAETIAAWVWEKDTGLKAYRNPAEPEDLEEGDEMEVTIEFDEDWETATGMMRYTSEEMGTLVVQGDPQEMANYEGCFTEEQEYGIIISRELTWSSSGGAPHKGEEENEFMVHDPALMGDLLLHYDLTGSSPTATFVGPPDPPANPADNCEPPVYPSQQEDTPRVGIWRHAPWWSTHWPWLEEEYDHKANLQSYLCNAGCYEMTHPGCGLQGWEYASREPQQGELESPCPPLPSTAPVEGCEEETRTIIMGIDAHQTGSISERRLCDTEGMSDEEILEETWGALEGFSPGHYLDQTLGIVAGALDEDADYALWFETSDQGVELAEAFRPGDGDPSMTGGPSIEPIQIWNEEDHSGWNEDGLWANGLMHTWEQDLVPGYEASDVQLNLETQVHMAKVKRLDENGNAVGGERGVILLEMGLFKVNPDGSLGDRATMEDYSIPAPDLQISSFSVSNISDQNDEITATIQVSGSLTSEYCDTIEGPEGVIDTVYVQVNGEDLPSQELSVQTTKESDPSSLRRPHPFSGSLSTTFTVELTEGNNTIEFSAIEDGVNGTAATSLWTILVQRDDLGSPGSGSIELQVPDGELLNTTVDQLILTYAVDGQGRTGLLLTETGADTGEYQDANQEVTILLDALQSINSEELDSLEFELTDSVTGVNRTWSTLESGADTSVFTASYEAVPSSVSGTVIMQPADIYLAQNGRGEVRPLVFFAKGPQAFVEDIQIEGEEGGQVGSRYMPQLGGSILKDAANLPFVMTTRMPDLSTFAALKDGVTVDKLLNLDLSMLSDKQRFEYGVAIGMGVGGIELVNGLRQLGVGVLNFGVESAWISYNSLRLSWLGMTGGEARHVELELQGLLRDRAYQIQDASHAAAGLWALLQAMDGYADDARDDILVGLLTQDTQRILHGDAELLNHTEELLSIGAEVVYFAMEEMKASDLPVEEVGYYTGRILFELLGVFIPAGKGAQIAAHLSKMTKADMLNNLSKSTLFKSARLGPIGTKIANYIVGLSKTRMCFAAGTLVMTSHGLQAIETIEPGDRVWSRHEETGEWGWKTVVDTFQTHPTELFEMKIQGNGDEMETFRVTGEHPFALGTEDGWDFVPVNQCQPGNEVVLADGSLGVIRQMVRERAPPGESFTTYNFEVEGFHTYFVGEAGVWVHNSGAFNCEELFSFWYRHLDDAGDDLWKAFDEVVENPPSGWKEAWPERWKLRLLNEIRLDHVTGSRSGGVAPPWRNALVRSPGAAHSADELGANLNTAFGFAEKPPSFTAHHIVMTVTADGNEYWRRMKDLSEEARDILKRNGDIDINDAANGTYLPNKHAKGADFDENIYGPQHAPLDGDPNFHTEDYLSAVVDELRSVDGQGRAAVTDKLQEIAARIVERDFPGIPPTP